MIESSVRMRPWSVAVIAVAFGLWAVAPALAQEEEAAPETAQAEGAAQEAGAAPAAAAATPARPLANGTRFGQWTLRCEAIAVDRTLCVLAQRLAAPDGGRLLAELVAFWDGAGATRYLSARVPEGAYLPSGFAVQPEGGEQIDFVWQACSGGFCEALIELGEDRLAAIAGADALVGGYRPALGADPVAFRFRARGLDDGLEALRQARQPDAD